MKRRDAKKLVGAAWLDSDYRIQWETRIMRRRVPLYKAGIMALRVLNNLTGGPDRPSLQVTKWDRVAPRGGTFVMDKLETMTGRTDQPVTNADELHARTSFATRVARAISADEWPQIIAEYERRKRGEQPQFHYVGHRPLNEVSHALMDKSWVKGELPTDEYKPWVGDVKYNDDGAFYSDFFTHGGARSFPGAETNPAFRRARIHFDVSWKTKASLPWETRVLRKSRVLRAQQLVKFFVAEVKYALKRHQPARPSSGPAERDIYTPEVVVAVADFVKPADLRSPTARGETEPSINRAAAIDVANTLARALPPPPLVQPSEPNATTPASRPRSTDQQQTRRESPGRG